MQAGEKAAKILSTYELLEKFPDEQSAIDYLTAIFLPDGPVCSYCQGKRIKTRTIINYYRCNDCSKVFTIRVGTVFEHSHIPLHKKTVKHSAKQFVDGMAYTKGIESVWAVLKRGYYETYHSFGKKHTGLYIGEFVFRLNEGNCRIDSVSRLNSLLRGVHGKRLTYYNLTNYGWK